MFIKNSPDWSILTNQILTFPYKKYYSLSNVENRKSLAAFVLELFNLQPSALFIEIDNSTVVSFHQNEKNLNPKDTILAELYLFSQECRNC